MDEQSQDGFIWIGGGVGTMDTADGGLLDMNASINYSKYDHIFKLRGIHAEEMVLFGPLPNDEVWELGLLYGRTQTYGSLSVSLLAGISYTGGIYKGDRLDIDYYEKIAFETVGIPLEAQIDVNLLTYIGLSIMFYADINLDKSYGGVNFAILLGKLPGLTGTTHFKKYHNNLR
ncbi:TPA: hypothetical protein DCR49_12135 [Candidatus Delongbacteria bacterium]|nr:MAG: hypothetical protein A2Y39_02260 [Candidatus Delongbacteria bacterium GWF2_40_14]HAQ62718.1 hypothetical protein [Candidatus Delongbacteria bacterium]